MGGQYPSRPPHFAHKFTRLLLRVCAAQDVGIEAFVLLTAIVHTEDAKRYRAPVTYWNDQLQAILGCSRGRLVRAREKAIEHGWLHYEAGTRGRAGRYWVLIPDEFLDMDDGSPDHDALELSSANPSRNGTESGRKVDGKWTESGRKVDGKRAPFFPSPIPIPKEGDSPSGGGFEEWWEAVPKKVGKLAASGAWSRAVGRLVQAGRTTAEAEAYLQDRMAAFAASPKGRGRFSPYPATWLNQGRYDDDPETWQDADAETAEREQISRDRQWRAKQRAKQKAELDEMARIRESRKRGGDDE